MPKDRLVFFIFDFFSLNLKPHPQMIHLSPRNSPEIIQETLLNFPVCRLKLTKS